MNILITGITGFAGSHLADYILENHKDAKIYGTIRHRSRTENIEHLRDQVEFIDCDLTDYVATKRVIDASKPGRVFHLAANSYVPDSWKMPTEVTTNNVISQINLLEAIRSSPVCTKLKTRIQVAGSSEEYGLVKPNEVPIKESNVLRPLSPYSVSKLAQDFLGYQYYKSYGLRIIRTRSFNHTGPRRGEVFVCSNFAKQIAEIEKYARSAHGKWFGKDSPAIQVGNLDAVRDFTDVRDTVRAYWLVLEKGRAGEVYNIGSGRMITMKDMLDILLGLTNVPIVKTINADRLRPSDVEILVCDYSKLQAVTGWEPEIKFKETLQDLLAYWRKRV